MRNMTSLVDTVAGPDAMLVVRDWDEHSPWPRHSGDDDGVGSKVWLWFASQTEKFILPNCTGMRLTVSVSGK